jgi:ribosome-associated toxin RatA of RatAB toxin-antitoxin module
MPSTTRNKRFGRGLCLAIHVAAACSATLGARADSPALTDQETALLAAGALVTRPREVRSERWRLIGGSSWQVIEAEPELVWRALLDVERYSKMVPKVIESHVVDEQAERQRVYIRQGAWPVFVSYYLEIERDPRTHTLRFNVDQERPHSLNAGWGFVRLYPYRNGQTLMAFGILADVGHGILAMVARSIIHKWMLRVPSTVKAFLESGGRELYGFVTRRVAPELAKELEQYGVTAVTSMRAE